MASASVDLVPRDTPSQNPMHRLATSTMALLRMCPADIPNSSQLARWVMILNPRRLA